MLEQIRHRRVHRPLVPVDIRPSVAYEAVRILREEVRDHLFVEHGPEWRRYSQAEREMLDDVLRDTDLRTAFNGEFVFVWRHRDA